MLSSRSCSTCCKPSMLDAAAACPALLCEQQLPNRCALLHIHSTRSCCGSAAGLCDTSCVYTHSIFPGICPPEADDGLLACLRHLCLGTRQLITQRCKFPVNTLESVLPAALHFTIHSPAQSCRQACSLSLCNHAAEWPGIYAILCPPIGSSVNSLHAPPPPLLPTQ